MEAWVARCPRGVGEQEVISTTACMILLRPPAFLVALTARGLGQQVHSSDGGGVVVKPRQRACET